MGALQNPGSMAAEDPRPRRAFDLPPAPPQDPPPAKKKVSRTVAFVVVGLVVAGAIWAAAAGTDSSGTASAGAGPAEVACIDVAASTGHITDAQGHLHNIVSYANAFDTQGIASEAHEVAIDTRLAAESVSAEPSVSASLYNAADHFDRASALMENAGPLDVAAIEEATSEISAANSDIDASTTALANATAPPC